MGASEGGFGRYECIEVSESQYDGHNDRVYTAASEMRCDAVSLAY
jgi:hypothetical protein